MLKKTARGPALGNIPFSDSYLRIKQNIEKIYEAVDQVQEFASDKTLTEDQIAALRNALQSTGKFPLNVTGLPGILLQVQPSITYGTHAKRKASLPAQYKNGLWAETDRNQGLYYSSGSAWILLVQIGYGTFETRWADLGTNDNGAQYFETSRNSVTSLQPYPLYRWNGNNWQCLEGVFSRNQNAIAVLQATLTTFDAGVEVRVPDYGHRLAWGGNNFNWATGDEGSGQMVFWEVDPSSNGWHLYDGSNNVNYLKQDGTLGNVNLPDLTSNNAVGAYPKAGSPNSGPNNASNSNFSASYTPAGSISTPTFTGNALAAHNHEVPIYGGGSPIAVAQSFGIGGGFTATASVASSAGGGSFATTLTSSVSSGTPSGSVSTPTFTGSNANISGNVTMTDPRNIVRRPFFRQ